MSCGSRREFLERCAAVAGKRVTAISAAAAEKLLSCEWPGNVRGLQNCMERAVALAQYGELVVEDLPERARSYRRTESYLPAHDAGELVPMDVAERRYIARVLEASAGNKSEAAKVLGFDRTTLYRKLERYGLAAEPAGE